MRRVTDERLAPMNIHFVQYPFSYFLESLKRLGLKNMELWGGAPHVSIDTISFYQVEALRRRIEESGLHIACFTPETCAYPVNLASPDKETRRRSLTYAFRGLEIAEALGVPLMQIVSGKGFFDREEGEAWKYSRDGLKRVAERASQMGICLTLEPLSPYESNLVNSLEKTERMLKEVDASNLGINVDTVPLDMTGASLEAYFQRFGGRVTHLHFCDRDEEAAWIPPGDGRVPLPQMAEVISWYEYGGYFGLEICGTSYYKKPYEALERAVSYFRECICRGRKEEA